MFSYKNTSLSVKTFYGVTFNPGDIHEVPGYINDPRMIRVSDKPKEPPKVESIKSPKATTPVADAPNKSKESKDLKEPTTNIKLEEQGGESDGTDNNK